MIPKYKTQLSILNREGGHIDIDTAKRFVADWVGDAEGFDCGFTVQPGSHPLSERTNADVFHEIVGNSEHWALRYNKADQALPLNWIVDVGIEDNGVRTIASISMGIELGPQQAVSVERRIRPPRIVRYLADRCCASAGRVLSNEPGLIDAENVDSFLDWLFSQDRLLPIVLISVDPYSERPLISPDEVLSRVFGISEVNLITKRGSFELTHRLSDRLQERNDSKLWTVHSGAVRIYWPVLAGRQTAMSPFHHKLWVPYEGQLANSIYEEILELTSWAAVHRHFDHWTDIDTVRARYDREAMEIRSTSLSQEETARYEAALERLNRKNAELEQRLSDAASRVESSSENEQAAWQQVREREAENSSLRDRIGELLRPRGVALQTTEHVIDRVRADRESHVVFATNLSIDTGEDGAYWAGVLQSLSDLCEMETARAVEDVRIDVRTELPRLLGIHGLPNRQPKHEDTLVYRTNPLGGLDTHMRWRLHMKSGGRGETESIYWEPVYNAQNVRKYLVGHIGHHL